MVTLRSEARAWLRGWRREAIDVVVIAAAAALFVFLAVSFDVPEAAHALFADHGSWKTGEILLAIFLVAGFGYTVRRSLQQRRQTRLRMAAEQKLERSAYIDPVTDLPNMAQLAETLRHELEGSAGEKPITLIAVGVSNFYSILSSFGPSYADQLRIAAAQRLAGGLPSHVALYELGGGAFGFFLTDAGHGHAMALGSRLAQSLDERFVVEGIPLLASGHFGVVTSPQQVSDSAGLLRASIAALRECIQTRQPHAIFDEGRDLERREALSILPSIQLAMEAQLTLHFQPKVDLRTGSCVGAEALVRWNHPEAGMLLPGRFIPVIEQTALIRPLTEKVIDLALRQLTEWWEKGLTISLAVNISPFNLHDRNFVSTVRDLTRFHAVDPHALELEITETALVAPLDSIARRLSELRALGVSIALDDFGTGHSSISHLVSLPADSLKLDRSLVRNLLFDKKTQVVVRTMIEAAHGLNLKVVAEGIEQRAVYDKLREASCDYGQGFLISKPVAAAGFEAWFRRNQTRERRSSSPATVRPTGTH